MDFRAYFQGKKVTVMRIGLLGRGIGDTAYMAEAGAEVLVVDDAPESVMQPAVDALSQYQNITFKFGPYENQDFVDCDFVLVGAGAPLDLPCLVYAREQGTRLTQSAALFAEISKIPIIGVTGTRGKSTVTHMIHHALSVITGEDILLGGNIRGVSNLQLLKQVREDSLAVMELDSWQLQAFGWTGISPQVAVFTNFMPDHMNYYKGDLIAYFADKANIFSNQEESGVLVTTPEVFKEAQAYARGKDITIGQEVVLVDESTLPEECLLSMPGAHNRLNAALAYSALKVLDLSDEEIFDALATFPGVPGRLEYLGDIAGVRVYNDNNSTTPQATIAGLKALGDAERKHIVLIMGGAFKEIDPEPMVEEIERYVKKLILLPGTGTDKLKTELNDDSEYGVIFSEADSLAEAVEAGLAYGEPGDVLLFSPGFASFGMFKNEYERNDQFVELIARLHE